MPPTSLAELLQRLAWQYFENALLGFCLKRDVLAGQTLHNLFTCPANAKLHGDEAHVENAIIPDGFHAQVLELAQNPPNDFWMHESFLGNDMPDQGRLCWPTLVRFRC